MSRMTTSHQLGMHPWRPLFGRCNADLTALVSLGLVIPDTLGLAQAAHIFRHPTTPRGSSPQSRSLEPRGSYLSMEGGGVCPMSM